MKILHAVQLGRNRWRYVVQTDNGTKLVTEQTSLRRANLRQIKQWLARYPSDFREWQPLDTIESGKSKILARCAKKMGFKVVRMKPARIKPRDILGMPRIKD